MIDSNSRRQQIKAGRQTGLALSSFDVSFNTVHLTVND